MPKQKLRLPIASDEMPSGFAPVRTVPDTIGTRPWVGHKAWGTEAASALPGLLNIALPGSTSVARLVYVLHHFIFLHIPSQDTLTLVRVVSFSRLSANNMTKIGGFPFPLTSRAFAASADWP